MINLNGLLTDIVNQLKSYTGANEVILADQNGPRPKEPFITIKVTTPYNGTSTHHIEERKVVPSEDPNFDSDIEYTFITHPKVTLSVNVYGDDTYTTVQKAREWFDIRQLSRSTLEQYKAVVREITAVQNRDTVIGGISYEMRQGFDVIIVIQDEVKLIVPTIEQFSIKEAE